jgi:hypothetical protein
MIWLGVLFICVSFAAVLGCENALSNLVGYTLIAATHVEKDQLHEVSLGRRATITLKNEMTFRFDKPPRDSWGYAGRNTDVFVFSRGLTEREIEYDKQHGYPVHDGDIYKLLIDGSLYELDRVR